MLSQKAKYGLKALLALARQHGRGPLHISDIARQETIPQKFLEFILLQLRNHGIVRSRKGKGGGYTLLRAPGEITYGEVVRILDGPLAPVPCASVTAYVKCEDCRDETHCGVRTVMKSVRDATAGILDHTTLADVLRQTGRTRPSSRSRR
jgi:Rrf2 family protein